MSADPRQPVRRLTRFFLRWVLFCVCLASGPWTFAESFTEDFESDTPTWSFDRKASQARKQLQQRTTQSFRGGMRSEAIQIDTLANDGRVDLFHKLPRAVRFDELRASVWVWSNHPGVLASVRVKLPNQIDQRTGRVLEMDVFGDSHTGGGQWQRLEVDLSDRHFEETMRRVRSDLQRRTGIKSVEMQGAYVDQLTLRLESNDRVTWDLKIDDLELNPIVTPKLESDSDAELSERIGPRVRIGDDRVLLDGLPFFPLIMPYHGESPEALVRSNSNLVWVPELDDRELMQRLSEAGLGVIATPPQPDLERDSPEQLGLLPFNASSDPILFWILDVQIPTAGLRQASAWAEMVRDADRIRARPIMADVMGKEREFHRQLSLVGASRSILNTTKSPRMYAETLDLRRRMALPGKPMFTLITTEPARELIESRPERATLPVVEPEQIWMQANIALAAGYKGLGYLSYDSLESKTLGAEERRRAIEINNFRVRILEPWLATAKVLQQAQVRIGENKQTRRSPLLSSWDQQPGVLDDSLSGIAARQIQATVLECDQGLLILLNWLEDNAQYQPGRMAARDVRILVNRDILQASELTTTNLQVHTLALNPVAGGTEIRVKDFNQSTIILVTNDNQAKDSLNRQITRIRPIASEAWASLVRAKYNRITPVHRQLVQLAPKQPNNADAVLRAASIAVDQAEKAHQSGNFGEVEALSRVALAYMRDLQYAHWKIAVERELSPASSPHTLCYQTLPDHWRLKQTLQSLETGSENLLPSGNFDNTDAVLDGWSRSTELAENSPIETTAALVGPPAASNLHIGAIHTRAQAALPQLEDSPVIMASPVIPVTVGQVIRVQGRILIKQPIQSTTDGILIYDSLLGTAGALRFLGPTRNGEWQDFEWMREVAHSGEMRLLFELKGLGHVWLDDLRVTATPLTSSPSLLQTGSQP